MTLTFNSYLAKAISSGELNNNKLGNFSVVNTSNPAIAGHAVITLSFYREEGGREVNLG